MVDLNSRLATKLKSRRLVTSIAVIVEIALLFLLVWRPTLDREIYIGAIEHQSPHRYTSSLRIRLPKGYALVGDTNSDPRHSNLELMQDGLSVGTPHSVHEDIRLIGNGAFSHWDDVLYFSTPENTDPRADGHRYSVRAKLELSGIAMALLVAPFMLLGASLTPALLRLYRSPGMQGSLTTIANASIRVTSLLRSRHARRAAALLVFVSVVLTFESDWTEYRVFPDSGGYVMNQLVDLSDAYRPPVMPIWMDLFSDPSRVSERIRSLANENQVGRVQVGDASDPILRPIQAQRLFLALSLAVLTWVLMEMMPIPSALLLSSVLVTADSRSVNVVMSGLLLTIVLVTTSQLLRLAFLRGRDREREEKPRRHE